MFKLSSGTQMKVDYTPSVAVVASDIVMLGDALTFPSINLDADKLGSLNWPSGTAIYVLDNSGVAFSVGDKVAVHTTNKNAVAVGAASSKFFGTVVLAATTSQSVYAVHHMNTDEFELIADPGDAGAIIVTRSSMVELVTAGAETRTIPDPVKAGVKLCVTMKTDGGDGVITAASPVNQTGNNTLTFAAVQDTITLLSIVEGAGFRWTTLANDGVALTTV